MEITDAAAAGPVNALRELADLTTVDNLASMAAVGTEGNPTGMLLAAGILSLNYDFKMMLSTTMDAVHNEAGYMRTLRTKWEAEMGDAQKEDTSIKAEVAELKARVAELENRDLQREGQMRQMAETIAHMQAQISNLAAAVVS